MMTATPSNSRHFFPIESANDELTRLRTNLEELEAEAIRKDQLLSQLMCRMREYEMGEYGLAEAVNEIKECKKVVRTRDREIEKLTDEINLLKLRLSVELELSEDSKQKEKHVISCEDSFLKEEKLAEYNEMKAETVSNIFGKDKSCQCQLLIYPSKCIEDVYISKLQNENLRLELSVVCENAIDSFAYFQRNNEQCQLKSDRFIKRLQDHLLKLQASTILEDRTVNNNLSELSEDGIKKTVSTEESVKQVLSAEESNIILQLAENWKFCKEPPCKDMVFKLLELELKLLNEILLLKKLLEIAHFQTRELEAMQFAQEIEIKSLKSQLALFQGKSEEKLLIGKLAAKVLQLQFSQAACLFELKKMKTKNKLSKGLLNIIEIKSNEL